MTIKEKIAWLHRSIENNLEWLEQELFPKEELEAHINKCYELIKKYESYLS